MKIAHRIVILAGVVAFLMPICALAYIDPGTGSYVLQLIIAAVVGVSFSIKIFWKKIVRIFRKNKPADEAKSDDPKPAP
jgi:hypothetical protein